MHRKRSRLLTAGALAGVLALGVACGEDSEKSSAGSSVSSSTSSTAGTAAAEFTFTPLDAGGPNTKSALSKGDIEIGVLFSSDGAIAKNGWVALEDDKHQQPVDNVVAAIRTAAPEAALVSTTLDNANAALTGDKLRSMVAGVSIDGQNPADVVKDLVDQVELPDLPLAGAITVGSANFAESEVVAAFYGQVLAKAGMDVSYKNQLGARETYLPALENGQIDVVPEFVGTLLDHLGGQPTSNLDETVDDARSRAEAKGISLNEPAPADSVNVFVVTKATADKYSLTKVSDLAAVPDSLRLGGPPECPTRQGCMAGLQDVYGLRFKR